MGLRIDEIKDYIKEEGLERAISKEGISWAEIIPRDLRYMWYRAQKTISMIETYLDLDGRI